MEVKKRGRKRGSKLQMQIIDLLVQGKSRKDIAAELDCSVKSVDNVKGDPELKRIYYERCNAQFEPLVPLAIKRLRTILENDKVQASVHVAAAREVISRSHLEELLDITQDTSINITVNYE